MARLAVTLLVVALVAVSFAQEGTDAGQLEGRGYFGYRRPFYGGYGGYGGYGLGYGGYGLANGGYFNPYGYGAGYGYGLGYRSGEQPAEGAPAEGAPVESAASMPSS